MAVVASVLAVLLAFVPVRPLGAAAVAVLLGAAGRGALGSTVATLPRSARGGLATAAGLVVASVLLLGLADLGLFGPVGVAAVALVLVVLAHGRPGGGATRVTALPLVLLVLAGGGAAAVPAYAFDLGGRDAGFYVLASERLRDAGGLVVPLDADVREAMASFAPGTVGADADRPLFGVFPRETDARGPVSVVPHGYGLLPSAMAGGATVTGGGGQWVVTFSGLVLVLLTAGAAALLAPRAGRRLAGGVAGGLLAGDAALIYFSRYPMTEVVSGVFLVTAGVAVAAAVSAGGRRAAALGGFALGAAPLVRPDAWPLVAAAPVAVLLLLAARRRGPAWAFVAGLVPLLVLAVLSALALTRAYTEQTVGYVLGGVSPTGLVVALAAFAGVASAAPAALPGAGAGSTVRAVLRRAEHRRIRQACALVVGAVTLVLVATTPATGLGIFREYTTRPGLLLAGAGIVAVLLGPAEGRRRVVPLLLLATTAALALALVARDPQVIVPDQYWTARRYLPLALPVAAVLGGVAAVAAWARRGRGPAGGAVAAVAGALVVLALAASLLDARPALTTTEFDGVPERIDRLDALLGPGDPLVLAGPDETAWAAVAPSLALREDRDVLMLATSRVENEPRGVDLTDPRFAAWLRTVARRRPVVLVTANVPPVGVRTDPEVLLPAIAGTVDLPVTQIEGRVGAPPAGATTRIDTLSVFRLEAPAG